MNDTLNNMKPPKFATILKRWTFGKTSNGTSSQRGSVIIFTVLIMGSMLAITLALASIYLPKIRALNDAGAGSVGAIYAADSALEWCIYTNRANPALPPPVMSNGATYKILPVGSEDCTALPLNNQAVGTYHGVSRSLEVSTQQ